MLGNLAAGWEVVVVAKVNFKAERFTAEGGVGEVLRFLF